MARIIHSENYSVFLFYSLRFSQKKDFGLKSRVLYSHFWREICFLRTCIQFLLEEGSETVIHILFLFLSHKFKIVVIDSINSLILGGKFFVDLLDGWISPVKNHLILILCHYII